MSYLIYYITIIKVPIGLYYNNDSSRISFEKGVNELKEQFDSENWTINDILNDYKCK